MVWSADQLTQGDSYVTATFKQLHFRDKLRTSLLLTVKILQLNIKYPIPISATYTRCAPEMLD